jgi:hypothetical protein
MRLFIWTKCEYNIRLEAFLLIKGDPTGFNETASGFGALSSGPTDRGPICKRDQRFGKGEVLD